MMPRENSANAFSNPPVRVAQRYKAIASGSKMQFARFPGGDQTPNQTPLTLVGRSLSEKPS